MGDPPPLHGQLGPQALGSLTAPSCLPTVEQQYVYLPELMALAACRSRGGAQVLQCLSCHPSPSPLNVRVWEAALRQHPDRDLADYIMQGIQQGFRIGIHEGQVSLRSAT